MNRNRLSNLEYLVIADNLRDMAGDAGIIDKPAKDLAAELQPLVPTLIRHYTITRIAKDLNILLKGSQKQKTKRNLTEDVDRLWEHVAELWEKLGELRERVQ